MLFFELVRYAEFNVQDCLICFLFLKTKLLCSEVTTSDLAYRSPNFNIAIPMISRVLRLSFATLCVTLPSPVIQPAMCYIFHFWCDMSTLCVTLPSPVTQPVICYIFPFWCDISPLRGKASFYFLR